MNWMVILRKGEPVLEEMLQLMRSSERFREVGGIAAFIGVVRSTSNEGEEVDHLELEAYEEKLDDALVKISNEIKERPGIVDVQIGHVVGNLEQGDLIMAVFVSGGSRKDVFPALIEAVERTKSEAPIWKKEVLSSGQSHWVNEK